MRKSTGSYPSLTVDTTAKRVVAHAGAVLLVATAGKVRLDRELSAALRPWMRPLAIHDPGKVLLDLAVSVAIGGDCLADIAQVRSEPAVFGLVASDPTVSRLIDTLASDAPRALSAINGARAVVRARAWELRRESRSRSRHHRGQAAGHRSGCLPARCALGEGTGGTDLPAGLGVFTPSEPGSTTVRMAPGNPPRYSSARAPPGRTPPPTTSRSPSRRCGNCRPPPGQAPRPEGADPHRRCRRHP